MRRKVRPVAVVPAQGHGAVEASASRRLSTCHSVLAPGTSSRIKPAARRPAIKRVIGAGRCRRVTASSRSRHPASMRFAVVLERQVVDPAAQQRNDAGQTRACRWRRGAHRASAAAGFRLRCDGSRRGQPAPSALRRGAAVGVLCGRLGAIGGAVRVPAAETGRTRPGSQES